MQNNATTTAKVEVARRLSGRRSGKKVLFQFPLSVAVLLVIFSVPEYAIRRRQYNLTGPNSLHPQALRDRFTAWRNNPDYGRTDIQHDAQGFRRNRDVSLEKPPSTIRIFLVGGSTAYGSAGGYGEIDGRYLRLYNYQLIDYYLEQKLNTAFPSRNWEVINAATEGYRINQQLALIESVLLRYRPDYIVSMDGYNDFIELYNEARVGKATTNPDIYANTPYADEFNSLANPGSFHSLFVFSSVWLRDKSALFRVAQNHWHRRILVASRHQRVSSKGNSSSAAGSADLAPAEQEQLAIVLQSAGYYSHVARQIHRILQLDGVETVFLLQPELILTRKPLTNSERRLTEYDRKIGSPLYVQVFQHLDLAVARDMSQAAAEDGFYFLNLVDVFDQTRDQAFTDFAHLTPRGNQIIADRIFQLLQDSFAAKAGRVPGKKSADRKRHPRSGDQLPVAATSAVNLPTPATSPQTSVRTQWSAH